MALVEVYCSDCNDVHLPGQSHGNSTHSGVVPGAKLWVKHVSRDISASNPKARRKRTFNKLQRRKKSKDSTEQNMDSEFPWKVVTVISRKGNLVTIKVDKQRRVVNLDSKVDCLPFEEETVEDMTAMHYSHEPGILRNIKRRTFNKEPYTFISNILISVNPLRAIPDPDILTSDNAVDWGDVLPPHPKSVAERAFRQMAFVSSQRLLLMDIDFSKERNTTMAPSPQSLIDKESNFATQFGLISQSIIVSGESGSGKTESAKRVLKQLLDREWATHLMLDSEDGDEGEQEFQDQLLGSATLLECLGNAATKRNPNSSRFGSFLSIKYQPVWEEDEWRHSFYSYGASFTIFLLERSRITFQETGERNFNVFYQLLTTPNIKLQKHLGFIQAEKKFKYLRNRFTKADEDRRGYSRLRTALSMANVGQRNAYLFQIIAAVLHIGNIEFEDDESSEEGIARIKGKNVKKSMFTGGQRSSVYTREKVGSFVSIDMRDPPPRSVGTIGRKLTNLTMLTTTTEATEDFRPNLTRGGKKKYSPLDFTSVLLGLKKHNVTHILLKKVVKVGKERFITRSTVAVAEQRRDALAKHIYSLFFDWVVHSINQNFDAKPDTDNPADLSFIGILDVFGFEKFQTNSLEQLLINYANEMLLAMFVREMIVDEQDLYKREGLVFIGAELADVALRTVDYSDRITLFQGINTKSERKPGIMSIISGQQKVPEPSDKKLLRELQKSFEGNRFFKMPHASKRERCFIITHYASTVEYTIDGFLSKNDQSLPAALMNLFKSSKHPIVKQFAKLYNRQTKSAPQKNNAKRASVRRKKPSGGAKGKKGMIVIQKPKRSKKDGLTTSVTALFQRQLSSLKHLLQTTSCHYIRCVKPNATLFQDHKRIFIEEQNNASNKPFSPISITSKKFAGLRMQNERRLTYAASRKVPPKVYFDDIYVNDQLRNLGVHECVSVLKGGYGTRMPYSAFVKSFGKKFPLEDIPFYRERNMAFREKMYVATLLQLFSNGAQDFAYKLGKTKVFFMQGALDQLSKLFSGSNIRGKYRKKLMKRFVSAYSIRLWKVALAKIQAIRVFSSSLERIRAARLIQRSVRRFLFMKLFSARVVERKAATLIQKHWRGFVVRRKIDEMREDMVLGEMRSLVSAFEGEDGTATELDSELFGPVEFVSDFGDDAFGNDLEEYFNRKTVYNRKTNALQTVYDGDSFKAFNERRQTVATGSVFAMTEDDRTWNDFAELALFELDGVDADADFSPLDNDQTAGENNTPLNTDEEENDASDLENLKLEEAYEEDEEEQAAASDSTEIIDLASLGSIERTKKNDQLVDAMLQPVGAMEEAEISNKPVQNRLNPTKSLKRKIKKKKTMTMSEWRSRLRPVQAPEPALDTEDEDAASSLADDADYRERAAKMWGATLRRKKKTKG